MWAWCHVDVKVKYRGVGVAKVTGPTETRHVSQLEAPEPDMLWDPSLKHMVAIFTEHWGSEREKRGLMEVKGHGVEEEGVGNSLPTSWSLFSIQMEVVLNLTATLR